MKVFKSREFTLISESLLEYETTCHDLQKEAGEMVAKPSDDLLNKIYETLTQAEAFCKSVRFDAAEDVLGLMNLTIYEQSSTVNCPSLQARVRTAHDAMMAAYWKIKLIRVPIAYAEYVDNESLLGDAVKKAFASAIPDIKEAGNCIAIDSGTAAVFHLMRVVEYGLRALCVHAGVSRTIRSKKSGKVKYKPLAWSEWETMLNALQTRIDGKIAKLAAGKKKQELQEFYYPLLQELRAFKEAFRNHVSHARGTYTAKEAEAVYEHVKRFMSLLATKVSE